MTPSTPLADDLKLLGLTGYEIKLYTTLLTHGTLSASELSIKSGVPKTAVYPHVENLVQLNLVQQLHCEPRVYQATSPAAALKELVDAQSKRFEAARKSVLPQLKALREEREPEVRREPVQLSRGNAASREITLSYFQKAKKFVNIMGWRYMYHDKARTHIHPKLLALAGKVKVRLIVTSESPTLTEYVKSLQKHGVEVRHYPIQNFSVVIRDGESCKLTLRPIGQESDKTNIRISDKDLAKFMNDYFMTIWKKAKKVAV